MGTRARLGRNRRTRARAAGPLLTGLVALLTACGGEDGARQCEVDEALLDEPRACVNDDDCPCGASCQFGVCGVECRSDSDCDEGTCDAFGRCRVDDGGTVAPTIVGVDPSLRTSTEFVWLTAEHPRRTVTLAHDVAEPLDVRVSGDGDVEVSCDGVTFGPECYLDVPAGEEATFEVRGATTSVDGRATRVAIHPRRGAPTFVRVQLGEGASLATPKRWAPLSDGATLRGTARILAAGAEGAAELAVDALPPLPVEMDVFPGASSQVVVIREPLGLLFPEAGAVGRLRDGALSLPAWRHIAADALTMREAEVVAQPTVERLRAGDGVLAFELVVRFADFASQRPSLRVLFDLQRVGDAPAGRGPSVPPSYVSPFAPRRGDAPTPWEALARTYCAEGRCGVDDAVAFACADDATILASSLGFADDTLATSGDVRCEGTSDARGFALDYVLAIESSPAAGRFGILADCAAEAGVFGASPDGAIAPRCVDPRRVAGVLASTVDAVRDAPSPDPRAAALAHRVLQQLVELGSYIAREGAQASRFDAALGGDCGTASCPTLATLNDYLVAASGALDVLLHPRYGQLLDAVAPQQPAVDYAAAEGLTVRYDGPPIAYSVMRTSVALLELLEVVLERAHLDGQDAPVDGLAVSTLRKVTMLRALASSLAVQADGGAGLSEPHASDFEAQAREFDRLFARAAARTVAMRRGDNALGIDEGTVPLYLDRDVETPEARAFALTNYLLDPSGENWIGRAIEQTEEAQRSAREAWATRLALDTGELQRAQDRATYRDALARDYGQQIASLCPVEGLTDTELVDALARGDIELDPSSCFIDTSNPACADFAPPSPVGPYQVVLDVCMAATLRQSSAQAGFRDAPEHNAFLDRVVDELNTLGAERAGDSFVLTTASGSHTIPEEALSRLSFGVQSQPSGGALEGFGDFNPRAGDRSEVEDLDGFRALTSARARCEQIADANVAQAPPVAPSTPAALDRAECYRGGLGSAALATRAAFTELETARARLAETYERYRIAVGSCTLQAQAEELFALEARRFEAEVAELNAQINDIGIAAGVFGAVTDAAANAGTVGSAAGPYAAAAVAVTSLVSSGLNIAAEQLQQEVDAKQAQHDRFMMDIERELDLRLCMNEASKEMVGLRTASLEIQRAAQELGGALLELQNLQRELRTLLDSGVAALKDDVGPQPYAGTLWLDESLRLFESRMRLARRVTFLAAMAVDYERQECNADGFRDRVLAARTPADLSTVRDDMLASTANRQIGDGTVGDAFVVLSLRDDILQLADRRGAPKGEPTLTPAERLRLVLTDPRYAVYERGEYLGQRVPFELLPPDIEPLGYSVGQGYFAQNHCAERLWSVNVGIAGQEGVSGSSTLARVEVLKHNEFFSQWCRPETACEDTPYQQTGVQPARNLFLDPFADGSFLRVPTSDPSPYSRVVLSNVRTDLERSDMEREDYAQGAQSGFAGRGLFGQYALFFPADAIRALCPDGRECGSSAGNALDLSRVDDIFIRFDYVAGVRP